MPILAASAACWSDDVHVAANRAAYGEKFALARRMLGNRAGFRVPDGGFFLWLDVGNGEETALRLWREAGVRTLPGAYMGRAAEPGKPRTNPGFSYLRVALVNDLSTISTALERMSRRSCDRRAAIGLMGSGVYRPRPKGAAMSDALSDARIALARLTQVAILAWRRGAGDRCLRHWPWRWRSRPIPPATRLSTMRLAVRSTTGSGLLGATAADVLLQAFGIAAFAFLAPLAVWGARAMMGKGLTRAVSRAVAWPLGTVLVAAGLGMLTPPQSLPAGAGGWIGIAASNLSKYTGQVYGQHWIGWALPLLLLIAGLPLAFIATGLRFSRVVRHVGTGAAAVYWLGGKVKLPKANLRREPTHDYDDEDIEPDTEIEDDDTGYALDIAPEPIAAARLAERRETRIKRDEARKAQCCSRAARVPNSPRSISPPANINCRRSVF